MHAYLTRFDTAVARLVAELPKWLLPVMNAVSFVGLPIFIIIGALSLAICSGLQGEYEIAGAALASLVALGANTTLKYIFHRARPDTIYVKNMKIHSYSFPSGHSCGSAVFYGLLAFLTFSYLAGPPNVLAAGGLTALVFLIGLSRIYLGAHFPSDVVVGWALGGFSLIVIVAIFLR